MAASTILCGGMRRPSKTPWMMLGFHHASWLARRRVFQVTTGHDGQKSAASSWGSRRPQDMESCAPPALAALKRYRGPAIATGTVPGQALKSLGACEASRPAARSPPPVIWSGLVVIQLLHQQVMIDDHAAVRDWTALTIAAIRPGRVDMRLSARRLPAIRPARLTARRPSRKDGRRGPSVSVGKLARLNSSRGSSIDRLVEVRISI